MIDIRKLKELVRLMVTNELTELDLRDSEEQVTLRRGVASGGAPVVAVAPVATAPAEESVPAGADDGLAAIGSPMVGTFYSAPNPDAAAFVTELTTASLETTARPNEVPAPPAHSCAPSCGQSFARSSARS